MKSPDKDLISVFLRQAESVAKMIQTMNEYLEKQAKILNKLTERQKEHELSINKQLQKNIAETKKNYSDQIAVLKQIEDTNSSVNETLCNVLLAIRQNEYLQAWYPAQSNFCEMKVVGSHPASVRAHAGKIPMNQEDEKIIQNNK